MRILLDECVNQRLRNYLPGHECQSARYAGLGGLKNGELLAAAQAAGFEVLLTVDRGFHYEQNLTGRNIAIIVFSTNSIALKDLLRTCRNTWLYCLRSRLATSPGCQSTGFSALSGD